MRKVGIWNNYVTFTNNQLFNMEAYGIGSDLGYPYILLKEKFAEEGVLLETIDQDDIEQYEKVIFLDVPNKKILCCDFDKIPYEKRILVITECEMIYKPNSKKDLLKDFSKVFTYNDDMVNKYNYDKLSLPNKMKKPIKDVPFNDKLLCTMVVGNKKSLKRGELYSKRKKWIKYMEKNHPKEFELYGLGWDERCFPNEIFFLNRIKFLKTVFFKTCKCYKGKTDNKLKTINKYKFCIAYENTERINGYISEKIWDVFYSGTIPVYLGASNIADYIPRNCFIDRREFRNDCELYNFLKNMTEEKYNEYLNNIEFFTLNSFNGEFSADFFAKTLVKEVLKSERFNCCNNNL